MCMRGVCCVIVSGARVKTFLDLVKFEHTVFALPFAYAGMLLASMQVNGTGWPGWHVLVWVTVAMAAAQIGRAHV